MPAQMDCVDVPRIAFDASADGLYGYAYNCGCDGNMTIVILYRNKWIFDKIRVIMMLLSEMRVTMALEYRKIVNKNEFSERGWIYGSYQSGCGCSGWYVGGSVEGVFLL